MSRAEQQSNPENPVHSVQKKFVFICACPVKSEGHSSGVAPADGTGI